jgi:hypothetical protein
MQDLGWLLPFAGGLAGFVIGAAARLSRFCTMAAFERLWYAGDSSGIRTWALASATAIAATQVMAHAGAVDLSPSFYLDPAFGWTGAILGGLAFGFGMALVGTCGFGALVRLGGGSLRAFVALVVLGLSALAAQRGLMAQVRVRVVDDLALDLGAAGDQSVGSLVSLLAGTDLRGITAIVVVGALFAWVFRDAAYRRRHGDIATAIVIGGGIGFGWLATDWIGRRAFEPVQLEAGSFVVPVGDLLMQFATFTGVAPDYGVGMVVGVALGAAAVAWRRNDVRWEACDDARELGRHIFGSFLMGTGGVFTMGCTIGQGISAASTLAVSVPVVMLSIAAGARLGLAYLLEGTVWGYLRNVIRRPAGGIRT